MPRKPQSSKAAPPLQKPQSGADIKTPKVEPQVEVLPSLPELGARDNRKSKDELNLVEYPWAALWQHENTTTEISHEWEVPDPSAPGKMVRATWRVTGDPKLGLPTANDMRLYMVLMELTREQEFAQEVTFTRYDLLKRLDWPDVAHRYEALSQSFLRLKSVTISARNAFRDARSGVLTEVAFSIIDNVYIAKAPQGRKPASGAEPPLSYFRWNNVIHHSLQQGFLATLDLDFALSLRSDVALSLYRLLSKKAHGNRSKFEMNLSEFYHRHLGLRPTRYPSKMKERLKTGHDELLDRGFLHGVTYEPMKTRRTEKIVYVLQPFPTRQPLEDAATDSETPLKAPKSPLKGLAEKKATQLCLDLSDAPTRSSTTVSAEEEKSAALIERVMALGVAFSTAQLLVKATPREALDLQLDCIADRSFKDLASTFVAAVRGQWQAPAAYLARKDAEASATKREESKRRKAARERELAQDQAERVAVEQAQNEALDARFKAWPKSLRDEIEAEVAARLKFVVQHLSEGAARGGWDATRRQVMRERDAREELAGAQAEAASHSARTRLLLSSDHDLDALWDVLSQPERARVDEQVRERIGGAGMAHFHPDHPGWRGVRRTTLREMLRAKLIPLPPTSPPTSNEIKD